MHAIYELSKMPLDILTDQPESSLAPPVIASARVIPDAASIQRRIALLNVLIFLLDFGVATESP